MKRTGSLSRRTRLRRGGALPRRGRARFRGYVPDKSYKAWIHSLPCAVAFPSVAVDSFWGWPIDTPYSCGGCIEAAHVTSRGAGGKDEANLVPLCTRHHRQQHSLGIGEFQWRYGVGLRRVAQELWDTYQGAL